MAEQWGSSASPSSLPPWDRLLVFSLFGPELEAQWRLEQWRLEQWRLAGEAAEQWRAERQEEQLRIQLRQRERWREAHVPYIRYERQHVVLQEEPELEAQWVEIHLPQQKRREAKRRRFH